MSYMVVSLLLSFVYGFMGMFLFVLINAPADNAFRVVWGSLAYWAGVAALAYFTVGWSSAILSIVGGNALLVLSGRPGDVPFTWGRALIEMGNRVPYLPTSVPCRFIGVRLKESAGIAEQALLPLPQAPVENTMRSRKPRECENALFRCSRGSPRII